MEAEAMFVTVYGPGWDQCARVDRVDWSETSLAGFVSGEGGEEQVLFVHLASVDAVFVSRGKRKKMAEEKS